MLQHTVRIELDFSWYYVLLPENQRHNLLWMSFEILGTILASSKLEALFVVVGVVYKLQLLFAIKSTSLYQFFLQLQSPGGRSLSSFRGPLHRQISTLSQEYFSCCFSQSPRSCHSILKQKNAGLKMKEGPDYRKKFT